MRHCLYCHITSQDHRGNLYVTKVVASLWAEPGQLTFLVAIDLVHHGSRDHRALGPERISSQYAPNGVSRLMITEVVGKLHQRHQGQPPRRFIGLATAGIEVGKDAIVIDRSRQITHGYKASELGKGRLNKSYDIPFDVSVDMSGVIYVVKSPHIRKLVWG